MHTYFKQHHQNIFQPILTRRIYWLVDGPHQYKIKKRLQSNFNIHKWHHRTFSAGSLSGFWVASWQWQYVHWISQHPEGSNTLCLCHSAAISPAHACVRSVWGAQCYGKKKKKKPLTSWFTSAPSAISFWASSKLPFLQASTRSVAYTSMQEIKTEYSLFPHTSARSVIAYFLFCQGWLRNRFLQNNFSVACGTKAIFAWKESASDRSLAFSWWNLSCSWRRLKNVAYHIRIYIIFITAVAIPWAELLTCHGDISSISQRTEDCHEIHNCLYINYFQTLMVLRCGNIDHRIFPGYLYCFPRSWFCEITRPKHKY